MRLPITVASLLIAAVALAAAPRPELSADRADRLFEQKHYAEAAQAYAQIVEAEHGDWHAAAERLVQCRLRLSLYDEALEGSEDYVRRTADTPQEARAERFTAHLHMLLPHWGTRAGGVFHRGEHRQGIRLQSWRHDKKVAVRHMERARALYARWDEAPAIPGEDRAAWHEERIDCSFDLAGLVARFSIYSDNPVFWHAWWGQRDDTLAETAGEEDFDEGYAYQDWHRKRPIGLRLDADGEPIFPERPDAWSADLGDDEKILFLLDEARRLDRSRRRRFAALADYRQAMLARKRFGMDRINAYAGAYRTGSGQPLQDELERFNPWELGDDEALVLAGGKLRRVTLPEQFDVLALLGKVAWSRASDELPSQARYAAGLYHQSRQQYNRALDLYRALREDEPRSRWARNARVQIDRILAPQARLANSGVQPLRRPAEIQLSYRNVDRIWFTARPFDLEGFLRDLHAEIEGRDPQGLEDPWRLPRLLTNWAGYLVSDDLDRPERRRLERYLGPVGAHWAQAVTDDGTHRYARTTVQAPMDGRGVWLVNAHLARPPRGAAGELKLGASRAVVCVSDLAVVEKHTTTGSLFLIADAVTGAPVPGARVSLLEHWNEYDRKQREHLWYARRGEIEADADGMVHYKTPPDANRQLHLVVSAGHGRLAWTGMTYSARYTPSRMRQGTFAYVLTDRPVYRPEQTVQYKVWMRRTAAGALINAPYRKVQVTVYNPRGDKVHEAVQTADEFGGIAGQVALKPDAALGVYRLQVHDGRHVGGGNFRVEEYKKPEFEVVVEPDAEQARLGQGVGAVVRANYYFGAPVTEATVRYKVFREEYTHAWYPPGRWDWLYGAGYGYGWYAYDWLPGWRSLRCWGPPPWWWGYAPPSRVRELVSQGEAPIGEDGTLRVEIDTAPALRDHPDRDHRYVVEAEVRDASRRTISGEGAVVVTRNAFYATVHADRGYARPGDEVRVTVRCMKPDGSPVQADGLLTVSSIVYGGPDNAHVEQKEIDRWRASTEADGTLAFPLRYERSGQLKVTFRSVDAWGETVEGHGYIWVAGDDMDGRLYRFSDLELITDRRTYRPGDVCHLMINTRRADSYVLLADEVDNGALVHWRLLHLDDGHAVVDVPVGKGSVPNFHVEALTVSDLRAHSQVVQVCVPPEDHVVDVTIEPDKAEYRPGESATVELTARTVAGEPADVQLALSAFDRSVLYIQPEYAPPITKFFHGQLRSHYPWMQTNLTDRFPAAGRVERPFQQIHPVPPGWQGFWGPEVEAWAWVTDAEMENLGGMGGRVMALGRRGGAEQLMLADTVAATKSGAVMEAAAPAAAPAPGAGGGAAPETAEPVVRQEFADTALWLADLRTGPDGRATATVEMPENLTTWKINAWAMSRQTQTGQQSAEIVTTKNVIVRLQAPRFFVEYDEVVLSANVHNYLEEDKIAQVSIDLPEDHLALLEGFPREVRVQVPAGGERRVDWRVEVLAEGEAAVTVRALTDVESDAVRMQFPVLVHGAMVQDTWTGMARPDDADWAETVELRVPELRRPELSRLEVQYAPSLVGAMMDALPYCLDYPYGCTEQTVSRFLPAVLTLKTLQNMGIDLEDVAEIRGRMDEVRRIERGEHRRIYADNPVFDSDELYTIINRSLKRIADMQHGDGGWSWWRDGRSSGYITCYVLQSLVAARGCDVQIDEAMIERGMAFLQAWQVERMDREHWQAGQADAFAVYVLSTMGRRAVHEGKGDAGDLLFQGRDRLNLYGKALLSLTLANLGDDARARTVLRNAMQYVEQNDETQIAWVRTPQQGWWYWYNNDIETNAWVLRALVRLEPDSPIAPRMVKWLLENRRNGYYWRSTRDTTLCVAAMSEFVVATGEGRPDYTLRLELDGRTVKEVRITPDNFFTYDNGFVLQGEALTGGAHTLRIVREGRGAVYWSAWLRTFSKERHIAARGLQLKLRRRYFLLRQMPFEVTVDDATGAPIGEKRLRYERVPLRDGDRVASGDLIQVELEVESDNDYTYLLLEDPKPAGCEPVAVRSGGRGQEGFATYTELRDEKVALFADLIGRGTHLMRYRLRAEVPGVFHALPAVVQGMYVPELRGNSAEMVIGIEEAEGD